MKTKTQIKAGRIATNHNSAAVRVKILVRAGGVSENHNPSVPAR